MPQLKKHCNSTTLFYTLFLLLINYHDSSKVSAGSSVKFLPGFDGPLPFELETGYIGVGESEEVQLFYYFVKSENDPTKDPLLLWSNGGPGCSALLGLLYEIGPIKFSEGVDEGPIPKLVLNPYSWNQIASIIFIDLPVGTGFSYATNPKSESSDALQSSDHAHDFIRKWLIDHPQFISNQVYIAGDSGAGIMVPIITQFISDGNDLGLEPKIDLKGYLLGNPKTTPNDFDSRISFAHSMGLISDELFESLKEACSGNYYDIHPTNAFCLQNMNTFKECYCVPYHAFLGSKGYRSLIYSGDHDLTIPFIGTEAWIRSLNWSIVYDWRPWIADGQVAGYTRTYANRMTFATIKGGGHVAPEFNPRECRAMFERWISYRPL